MRSLARLTGAVYLAFLAASVVSGVFFAQAGINLLGGGSSDPAVVAAAMRSHVTEFRIGFAFSLILIVFYVSLTALLYRMFRPVNPSVALAATLLGLVGLTVQACGGVFQLVAFSLADGGSGLGAFSEEERQSLLRLALGAYSQAYSIGLTFDAPFLLLLGYLIYRSGFAPRAIGALLAIAGIGWLTVLWPPLAAALLPLVVGVGGLAELALMVWLLFGRLDEERWLRGAGEKRPFDTPTAALD